MRERAATCSVPARRAFKSSRVSDSPRGIGATAFEPRLTAKQVKGQEAEDAALAFLLSNGCTFIGRNVRVSRLEIDLIVRDGPVVAVVEVRHRGPASWVLPLTSVDAKKRLRIRRAGESLWRSVFKKDASLERMRFDIVSVRTKEDGSSEIEHVRAAF